MMVELEERMQNSKVSPMTSKAKVKPELVGMRPAYGEALVELGRANPRVVVLTADVSTSDASRSFMEEFPDRYFDVGIAEQSLVDVAVGLAHVGAIPFVNAFAVFLTSRALEPVLTHASYGKANLKLVGHLSGLSPQMDGPTHHSITDIATMRTLPGMTVVCPADAAAMRKLLPQVAMWPGPVYLRVTRHEVPSIGSASYVPVIGRAGMLRDGGDVTLVGIGTLVSRCLEASVVLAREGIDARVLDVHTVKPLDGPAIIAAARETGGLVVAEEHSVIGGLAGAIAEVITESGLRAPLRRVGMKDRFAASGGYFEMLDYFGMSVMDVVDRAREVVSLKRSNSPTI
jgi:transketolase